MLSWCFFNREINEKYFFSDIDISASRSPFFKSKIKIIYSDESLERMVIKIKEDNLLCIRIKDGQGISKYSNER